MSVINALSFAAETHPFALPYGVCETSAYMAAKTVTVDNFSLEEGAMIIVRFYYGDCASGASTLNVNGTGAKTMIYDNLSHAGNHLTYYKDWTEDSVQMFTYDGTYWVAPKPKTYTNASLGQGYGTCSTVASTTAKVVSLSSYALTTGGIVSVKFSYVVPAGATMNINDKGAKSIYYRGAAITANIIGAGDTATFIYYGSKYHLLAVDRWQEDITELQKLSSVITPDASNKSVAEGHNTTASGYASHAEGASTTASGGDSHAEGCLTTASGTYSHAEGYNTTASGECSHAEGYRTTAKEYQHVQGHFNNTSTAAGVSSGTSTGAAFVIGNGTTSSGSNAFRVTYAGKPYSCSSITTTGADYAEFFEWQDSNLNAEDRRGYFVTLDGDKIKIAEPNDYILGIVSALPAVIGNGDEDWRGRYILDDFGAFIVEEFEYESKVFDKETGETKTITKTGTKYKENPDYDSSIPYIQREDRPEWDTVGMMGVLAVRDDGTCEVNGYCKVAEGGIATTSENGYRVIGRVNDNIVKVVFR